MSVLKIVQTVNSLAVTGTAATTNGITLQSGILRVSAASTNSGCNIAIGENPIATGSSFYVAPSLPEIIKERIARQRIGTATTGTIHLSPSQKMLEILL
jgi:hypothetical protein